MFWLLCRRMKCITIVIHWITFFEGFKYIMTIKENLIIKFIRLFAHFENVRRYADIFYNPLTCSIENTRSSVCKLQTNLDAMYLAQDIVHNIAFKYCSMFDSTLMKALFM